MSKVRSCLLILLAAAAGNFAVWGWLNRPLNPPPFEGTIAGVSFSPYRADQDPVADRHPSAVELAQDLDLLKGQVLAIRTYSSLAGIDAAAGLAGERGLQVTLGAWLDRDLEENEQEIERAVAAARRFPSVTRVIVGNESLLRGDLEPHELIAYLRRVREAAGVPVSTAEPWHVWLKHPELAPETDFVAIHVLPYWEGVPIERAVQFVIDRQDQLEHRFAGKPVVLAEVGWPSNGRVRKGAVPSLANEARFLREFLAVARARDLDYFLMEAFDQPWKIAVEGGVGAYWGVFDVDRQPKFAMVGPVVDVAHWPLLAGAAVLLPLLPLLFFLLRADGYRPEGRLFFAGLSQVAASALVWVGHLTAIQYHTTFSAIAWCGLLGFLGLLLVVGMTEAFELTELLWKRRLVRRFPAVAPVREARRPKVSIHLPICNEPPEMVIQTLNALRRLDYPDLEVLVIDNNTLDPGLWKPVADHCQILGPSFRFFHLDRCPGFKAGALNFALTQTDPAAEVVGVIDSDYLVRANWLKNLVPYLARPEVAIVQAPQDYRDGGEGAFKRMCFWEYTGFFHIGMVHRNERNAIIQHGTMTLVRRAALEAAGGWAEWCIVEDAELGLRLFARGHEAVYVNHSYGRGLTPDSFAAYKGQRFRWAYGAMQILKRHWKELLLPGGSAGRRLSPAQRYHFVSGWLPWFADALNGAVTAFALVWSAGVVFAPRHFELPLPFFLAAAFSFFGFKVGKSVWLYGARIHCSLRDNAAAAVAGLALSHTIARAVVTGLVTSDRPFLRTPKLENKPAFVRGLAACWQETLLCAGLALAALGVALYGGDDVEARLWVALLTVQALPYAAALATSALNAMPPGRVHPVEGWALPSGYEALNAGYDRGLSRI